MNRYLHVRVPSTVMAVDSDQLESMCQKGSTTLGVVGQHTAGALLASVANAVAGNDVDQTNPRDHDLWHVQVAVSRPVEGGWTAQRTLPTFTLDGALHGIESVKGAATIAADVLLVDIMPKDWTFVAVIRRGNTDRVYSVNLATLNVWEGDHVSDRKDLS